MKVSKTMRKSRCAGVMGCMERVEYEIKFSKYNIKLCAKCAQKLIGELNKFLVPRGTKSKFNLER